MNFQRQPVDYSFVPMAFSQAKKNVASISDFAFKQKRQQEFEENLKRVKASREQVEQAREETIVELASQYREAAGLPENDAGRSRALSVVSSAIYPLTSKEMNDPNIAAVRINDFELNQFPKILNKAKMDRYREETKSTQERVRPEGAAPLQAPEGTVGVEDEGVQRTISGPKSLSEMQTQVHEEALREPYAAPTVSRDPTAQERYEKARDLGIEMEPAIQYDIGQRGREELTQEGEPEDYTREEAYRDISRKPVVQKEMETYAKSFPETPEPESELDRLKIEKIKVEIDKLRRSGSKGDEKTRSIDIRWAADRVDDLSANIIKYNKTINKLRQAKRRLMANEPLSFIQKDDIIKIGMDSETATPDVLKDAIDRYADLVDDAKKTRDIARITIKELSEGKNLAQAMKSEITESEERHEKDFNAAIRYLRRFPNMSGDTIERITRALPSGLQNSFSKELQLYLNEGNSEQDVKNIIFGAK